MIAFPLVVLRVPIRPVGGASGGALPYRRRHVDPPDMFRLEADDKASTVIGGHAAAVDPDRDLASTGWDRPARRAR